MKKLLANPKVRLALRSLVAAVTVIASGYAHTGSVNRALIVGAVLAFVEVFTPLNGLVGFLKLAQKPAPVVPLAPLPAPPPAA